MSKLIKFNIRLSAKSPLHFGGEEQGILLKDSENKPFIMGSSIAGSIKSYLKATTFENKIINNLGGEKEENKSQNGKKKIEFIESKIIISDAKIFNTTATNPDPLKKEGTMIDRATGSAKDGNKYILEYLDIKTEVQFTIEKECNSEEEEKEFVHIIKLIKYGFNKHHLRLGGQVNNGFGKLNVVGVEYEIWNLKDKYELIEFILKNDKDSKNDNRSKKTIKFIDDMIEDPETMEEYINSRKISFSMKGSFPYGVYQAYENTDYKDKSVTSLQKNINGYYYIPSTSIKGLIRSELEMLFNQLNIGTNEDGSINTKINDLFGGKLEEKNNDGNYKKGSIEFEDVIINKDSYKKGLVEFEDVILDGSANAIKSFEESEKDYATYNKVDRLTGGSLNGALFNQKDIEGNAEITFTLNGEDSDKYIYPILLILRNIYLGIIPIGGRTSVGLGEFEGVRIGVLDSKSEYDFEITTNEDKNSLKYDEKSMKKIKDKFISSFMEGVE